MTKEELDVLIAFIVLYCRDHGCLQKRKGKGGKMTNGDKIRQMSDEELARFIMEGVDTCSMCPANGRCETDPCVQTVFDWLKQEAKDGEI